MKIKLSLNSVKIGVIGLGYVGLPLAVEFAKKYRVVGFDISSTRIEELNLGIDSTMEISDKILKSVLVSSFKLKGSNFFFPRNNSYFLKFCNVYIVTVPTPIDKYNFPLLTSIIKASETVSKYLKKGDIVIYESTVYPGVTEEKCVPILEKLSGLKFNSDFFAGYSPERINPGDKEHTLSKILKVISGSTPEITNFIDKLYSSVITAGTFKANSIKVAEAAKVIENSQRDINIAFVNELSKIFNLLGIDTNEVLEAAGTKWNFLKFKPGLVGGHCIGVDPFYLAKKAQEVGYHPEIILAGRRLNDSMGKYIVRETIKLMMKKKIKFLDSKALILGFTFKENCPDIRNTRVIDIYKELISFNVKTDVYDPWASPKEVKNQYKIEVLSAMPMISDYSAVILAVSHKEFKLLKFKKSKKRVIFDIKGILPKDSVDLRL